MIEGLDYLRDVNTLSVLVRMLFAFASGGIIGIEREYKRRSAGFRTHILVCVGGCMTNLTGQYLAVTMHYTTDISRLGAQVISGIGFLGAGAIILTRNNEVRGITTSAGLWACAITGLAYGAGFYEGGFISTALILFSETVFSKYEHSRMQHDKVSIIYIEYLGKASINNIVHAFTQNNIIVKRFEPSATMDIKNSKKKTYYTYVYVDENSKGYENLSGVMKEISSVVKYDILTK